MKEKLKSLTLNLLLLFGIFFFVLLIYLVYIAGPNRAYEKEDRQFVEAFGQSIRADNLNLENRFSFSNVYYIVSDSSKSTLYWFTRDMKNSDSTPYQDFSLAQKWANTQGLTSYEIEYGVYDGEFVYVVSTPEVQFILDFETQDIVLRLGV